MGMKRNNRKASKRQIFAAFELKNIKGEIDIYTV